MLAARVASADEMSLLLLEGDELVTKAHVGSYRGVPHRRADDPDVRWISQHGTLHIPDRLAQTEFPEFAAPSSDQESNVYVAPFMDCVPGALIEWAEPTTARTAKGVV